jgi:hypothetical protein
MSLPPDEVGYDAKWLQAFVHQMLVAMGMDWAEGLIPGNAYTSGATDIVNAASEAADQSPAGRLAAGEVALRKALDSTGQGGRVTDAQVAAGTAAVLKADATYAAYLAREKGQTT